MKAENTEINTAVNGSGLALDGSDAGSSEAEMLDVERNEGSHLDPLHATKEIMIRKAQIMAEVYRPWYWRCVLIASAFIIGFGYMLDANNRSVYMQYALNSLNDAQLVSTLGIINSCIGACGQLLYARLADVVGRVWIMLAAIVLYAVGTIIQGQAHDVARYAAGSVIYNLGYVGVIVLVLIIMSDASTLRYRMLYQIVAPLAYVVVMWVGGSITQTADPLVHWSWDVSMWAFIFPLSSIPFMACMLHMWWKASDTPEWKALNEKKSYYDTHGFWKTLIALTWRVDLVGLIMVLSSIGCILVPISLAGGIRAKWTNPRILAPFCLGFALVPLYLVWEYFGARDPLVPWRLLKNRGVWAPLAVSFVISVANYLDSEYLYEVLVIGAGASVESATRITSLSSFVSVIVGLFLGLAIALTPAMSHLKPGILLGAAMYLSSEGILYHFRGGADSKTGITGSTILAGFGTRLLNGQVEISGQAAVSHYDMATATALFLVCSRIGSAVGAASGGAIVNNYMYDFYLKHLGNSTLAMEAYRSPYTLIESYPWGSPVRNKMVLAMRDVQGLLLTTAMSLVGFVFVLLFFIRDPDLSDKFALEDSGKIVEGEEDIVLSYLQRVAKTVFGVRKKVAPIHSDARETEEPVDSIVLKEGMIPENDNQSSEVQVAGPSTGSYSRHAVTTASFRIR